MSNRGHINWDAVHRQEGSHAPSDRVKRYVEVVSRTTEDGRVIPLVVVWDDGRRFEIDKVLDKRQAHSLKTGGTGMRYTVRVGGHNTYLYYDDYRGRWFVEAKY